MLNCAFTLRLVYSLRFLVKLLFLGLDLKSSTLDANLSLRVLSKAPESLCSSSFNQ
jgi:hypothetical protein